MTEQLRKEFEVWAEDYGHDISRSETNPDDYHDLVTEWVFDAWKAARAEADETIAAQQRVLNGLAEMLGVAEDGLIREVERLKKAVAKYAGLHIDDLHEALAAGEVG